MRHALLSIASGIVAGVFAIIGVGIEEPWFITASIFAIANAYGFIYISIFRNED